MDIYKDVIGELEKQGYYVDFIAEKSYPNDPNNIRRTKRKCFLNRQKKKFEKQINQFWTTILESEQYKKKYDYLFVIDGQAIRPVLFDILKSRNPNIKCINYLFDTTKGVYRFDLNFPYFDKIYTFDIGESVKFKIQFLPIYWVPSENENETKYDLFGLGRYNVQRYELFGILRSISDVNNLNSYLKLHSEVITSMVFYKIKYAVRVVLGIAKNRISPKAYCSVFNTTTSISPYEFRQHINSSRCIVDTSAPHQDGLTARFMWALGAERKIITTNQTVKEYNFYSPKQIFVVDEVSNLKQNCQELVSFVISDFKMNEQVRESILKYRLDNWLYSMFS